MQWKDVFEEIILQRGYGYYRSGAVHDLKVGKNSITAKVDGTEMYRVQITLDGSGWESMECSCPYAEDGNYCKHMAAVLYAAEKMEAAVPVADAKAAKLVQSADTAELRKFLIELVQEDDAMFLKLKSFLAKKPEEINMKLYQKQIDKLVRKYAGRYNYIEYEEVDSFTDDMESFLKKDVPNLIGKNLLDAAFELVCLLFDSVSAVDLDDSGGCRGGFYDCCVKTWQEILEQAEKDLQETCFSWVLDKLKNSPEEEAQYALEEFLMQAFQSPEFLQKKFLYTEERAAAIPWDSEWGNQYSQKKWALYHITVMEQLHQPEAEILAYCRKYWRHSDIRRYVIQSYLKHGKTEKAILLLEESLVLDESLPGLVTQYQRMLKDLYKQQGNLELYRNYLFLLVKASAELEDFRELKAAVPEEEWLVLRERIFFAVSPYKAAELYQEEGLYDRLLHYVLSLRDVDALMKYENSLKTLYPEQILQRYETYLMQAARGTASRKIYQEWATILRHMTKIKGGKAVAHKIIKTWHQLYPRRIAMMQEIDKVIR